jgi:hypothetical protein
VGSQLRLIIISSCALLVAVLPATSGAARAPSYVHDVKVFHQSAGHASKPQPATIAVLVGGRPVGKMISGLNQNGTQFVITAVPGSRVALTRATGPRARVSVDVTDVCRSSPSATYYLRATARIAGKARTAYTRGGDCSFVLQVVGRKARALTHTTFIFEN